MTPYWAVCTETGVVVVENIFEYGAARAAAEKLVAEFDQPFVIKEYGLRSEAVILPKAAK